LLQFGSAEMAEALAVEIHEWAIDLLEHIPGFGRQVDMYDPPILFASGPGDEAVVLKPAEQSGHRRRDLNHATANLHALHGSSLAPENAQHVVLGTRQAELAKELSESVLEQVARASDVEHRLLLRRFERLLLSEFLLERFASHGVTVAELAIRMRIEPICPAVAAKVPFGGEVRNAQQVMAGVGRAWSLISSAC